MKLKLKSMAEKIYAFSLLNLSNIDKIVPPHNLDVKNMIHKNNHMQTERGSLGKLGNSKKKINCSFNFYSYFGTVVNLIQKMNFENLNNFIKQHTKIFLSLRLLLFLLCYQVI